MGAQLAHHFRKIIAHGAFRKAQAGSNFGAAGAIVGPPQHLAFTVAQRVGFRPCLGRQFGVNDPKTRMNAADRIC